MVELEDMTTGQILTMCLVVLICMFTLLISVSAMFEYFECYTLSEDGYDVEVTNNGCKIIYEGVYLDSSDYEQVALLNKLDVIRDK